MAECVLVYQGKESLSDDNKALLLAKHLLTRNIPQSPSEGYSHILKIAQGAPFCVLDKTSTLEQSHQGNIHAAADIVLKAILPKLTYELIPLIISLLNSEDVQHPALENLFTVIPSDEPDSLKLEGMFMLLSNWENSSLEVYNIKIKQTRETFLRHPVKISGICYYSSFTVMLPVLVDFMQNMEYAEEWVKNVLEKGFKTNYKAISSSEYFPEMTNSAVIYLEDLWDQTSMFEAKKAVVLKAHSLLTHNLPQSPSDRYDYVQKQAGTFIQRTDEDNKFHTLDLLQGNNDFAVEEVLKEILPKSTYGLIPTIVSLLNCKGDPHPVLRKLFTFETAKYVEGFFMLLSNWESFTFEVFHIKIQQALCGQSTVANKISGTCRSSLFTVTPQSIQFDSVKNADKEIQKLHREGLQHGAAIKQCMQSYIPRQPTITGGCGTTTCLD